MTNTGTIGKAANINNPDLPRGKENLENVKNAYLKYFNAYKMIAPDEWIAHFTDISLTMIRDRYKDYLMRMNWFAFIYDGMNKVKKQEVIKKRLQFLNPLSILKTLLALVGICATYMSVYYSNVYLRQYLNIFNAFILAITMVVYAVISFEFIVHFYIKKYYKLLVIFSVLWFVSTLFSMVSTIAGQYNVRMTNIIDRKKTEKQLLFSNQELDEYNKKTAMYTIELEKYRNEDNRLINILLSFDNSQITSQAYRDINYTKIVNDRKIKEVIEQINNLKKPVMTTIIYIPDFYEWISKILNIQDYMIQFWLSFFPAIFIDLIAPISIAVVIYLKRE